MKVSSKLTQASSQDGLGARGQSHICGVESRSPTCGQQGGRQHPHCATLCGHLGSIPRGRDAVGHCWAWGAGVLCAACMKLVDMKSQNPATNEKWEAWDVMLKGRNYQLWESL